ncbi:hypothetical protein [Streptomyces rubrogriseus]|uniref:hypothetical protein n=1 Tax=Streptomyces rubrogriseus TaxID=194673 RepID=UPI00379680F0
MSDAQGWLIPLGADGGEFKWEVQFLQSIARPLEESTAAARKIAGERAEQMFDDPFQATEDKTGAAEVTEAVGDFLDKWCHGLGCIADDADVTLPKTPSRTGSRADPPNSTAPRTLSSKRASPYSPTARCSTEPSASPTASSSSTRTVSSWPIPFGF